MSSLGVTALNAVAEQGVVQIFHFEDRPVRAFVNDDGHPWWLAGDVCEILGIQNVGDVLSALEEDEKGSIDIVDGTPGSPRRGIVNEPGLYSLILRSRKPEARKFKRWVTHEVIPSIRRSGYFALATIGRKELAQVVLDAEMEIEASKREIALLSPKAQGFDAFMDGRNAQSMAKAAKSLGTGRTRLFKFLKGRGVLMRNNLPYQSYIDRGYFRVVQKPISRGEESFNYAQPMVTPKGLDYICRLLERDKADVEAV